MKNLSFPKNLFFTFECGNLIFFIQSDEKNLPQHVVPSPMTLGPVGSLWLPHVVIDTEIRACGTTHIFDYRYCIDLWPWYARGRSTSGRQTTKVKLCGAAGKSAKTLLNSCFPITCSTFCIKYIFKWLVLPQSFIANLICICRLALLYTDFCLCISHSSYSVYHVVYYYRRNNNSICPWGSGSSLLLRASCLQDVHTQMNGKSNQILKYAFSWRVRSYRKFLFL